MLTVPVLKSSLRKSMLPVRIKSQCEQGETSANTGCTPASGEVSDRKESAQEEVGQKKPQPNSKIEEAVAYYAEREGEQYGERFHKIAEEVYANQIAKGKSEEEAHRSAMVNAAYMVQVEIEKDRADKTEASDKERKERIASRQGKPAETDQDKEDDRREFLNEQGSDLAAHPSDELQDVSSEVDNKDPDEFNAEAYKEAREKAAKQVASSFESLKAKLEANGIEVPAEVDKIASKIEKAFAKTDKLAERLSKVSEAFAAVSEEQEVPDEPDELTADDIEGLPDEPEEPEEVELPDEPELEELEKPEEPDEPGIDFDTKPARDDYGSDEDHQSDVETWKQQTEEHVVWKEEHAAWEKEHKEWEEQTDKMNADYEQALEKWQEDVDRIETENAKAQEEWQEKHDAWEEKITELVEKANDKAYKEWEKESDKIEKANERNGEKRDKLEAKFNDLRDELSAALDEVYSETEDEYSTLGDKLDELLFAELEKMDEEGEEKAKKESGKKGLKSLDNHKKGCLLLPIPMPLSKQLTDWAIETILDDHLAEEGRGLLPHVTVLYGFPPDFSEGQMDELRGLLARVGPIEIKLSGLDTFRGGKDGDVLYAKIESPQLAELNAILADAFGIESDHDQYLPHLTIAYLQHGNADLYLEETPPFAGQSIEIGELEFGHADKRKELIQLSFLPQFGIKKYAEHKDKRGSKFCTDDGVRVECRGGANQSEIDKAREFNADVVSAEDREESDKEKVRQQNADIIPAEEKPIESPQEAKEAVESQASEVEKNEVEAHEFTPEQAKQEQGWQDSYVDYAAKNPKAKLQPKDVPSATRFMSGLFNATLGGITTVGALLGKMTGLDEVFKEEIEAIKAIRDILEDAYPGNPRMTKMAALLCGAIMGDAGVAIAKQIAEKKKKTDSDKEKQEEESAKETERQHLESRLEALHNGYQSSDDPEEEAELLKEIEKVKRDLESKHDADLTRWDEHVAKTPKAQRKRAFERVDDLESEIYNESDPKRRQKLEANLEEAKRDLIEKHGVDSEELEPKPKKGGKIDAPSAKSSKLQGPQIAPKSKPKKEEMSEEEKKDRREQEEASDRHADERAKKASEPAKAPEKKPEAKETTAPKNPTPQPDKSSRDNPDLDEMMNAPTEPEPKVDEKTELRVNQLLDDIFGKSFNPALLNWATLAELDRTEDPRAAMRIARKNLEANPKHYMPKRVKDAHGNEVELGQVVKTRIVSNGVLEKVITEIAFPGHDYNAPAKISYSWDLKRNGQIVERYISERDALNAVGHKSLGTEDDKGIGATLESVGKWVAARWAKLEARHGRRMALAIALSQLSPVPFVGTAVIAIAEATRGLRGYTDVKPADAKMLRRIKTMPVMPKIPRRKQLT